MKKIILSFITLISFFSLSHGFEANIKFGYDFFRRSTIVEKDVTLNTKTDQYTRGFVLGVEILPVTFMDEKIKFGAGVEYNFGETSVRYTKEEPSAATMIPLYITGKFTYYRPKNTDLNLYTFVRLGYAFSKGEKYEDYAGKFNYVNIGGFYYGLGFGLDYKYFLAEILYEGKYYYKDKNKSKNLYFIDRGILKDHSYSDVYAKDFHHKLGVRLGVQLGTQHFKKPQIK